MMLWICDDLGGTRELDAALGENRHEALAEGLERLHGVPDLADPEVATGTEGGMPLERPSGGNSPDASMVFCAASGTSRPAGRRGRSEANSGMLDVVVSIRCRTGRRTGRPGPPSPSSSS